MVAGLGYFPVFVLFALKIGPEYAVLGQLMMLFGVIYLLRNAHLKMPWGTFLRWTIKPLASSLVLMISATFIHSLLFAIRANFLTQLATLLVFYLVGSTLVIHLENHYFAGRLRIETLRRALSLASSKFTGTKNLSS